jgi:hypothetical protein
MLAPYHISPSTDDEGGVDNVDDDNDDDNDNDDNNNNNNLAYNFLYPYVTSSFVGSNIGLVRVSRHTQLMYLSLRSRRV